MISYILLKPILWLVAGVNFLLKWAIGYSTFSGKVCHKEFFLTNFECSAHRLRVILRAAPVSLLEVNLDQFLLTHVSYEDPRECIAKDNNVALMNIDSKYALFAVTKDGFNVYSSTHGPFLFR